MKSFFTNRQFKLYFRKLFLFLALGLISGQFFAASLVLSSTTYENKVVVEHCDSYNACFWIGGGWSRIDWYVNGTFYDSDAMYGMAAGYQTIVVEGKEIDCSHLNPGATVTITAKAYHHDAYTFGYWDPDLVATQTLKNYTNVSNVQASDGVYMTKIVVDWDVNEMFDSHNYTVQRNSSSISGTLGQGTSIYTHSGLEPGSTGNYRIVSNSNSVQQISSTNQGFTFDPNMEASSNLESSVAITWTNTGPTYQANGFFLDWFNDETDMWELLWERDDNVYNSKTDNGAVHTLVPGYTYQYRLRVKPIAVSDVVAYASGKISSNGQISGYVRTPLPNQVPVNGVEIKVVLVGDALPTDTTTTYITYTNTDGYYEINNIFYNETADFVVTPILEDRIFDPINATITLNTGDNIATADFIDLSSFAISGTIMSQSCPVSGVSIIVDNDTTGVITDIDGNFVVTVSSGGTYTVKPHLGEHLFDPQDVDVVVTDDVTGIDFSDTTLYLVEGYLAASCNTFIGEGEIRFYSMDDAFCFDQTITTDEFGYYSIYLPSSTYRVNVPSFTSEDEIVVNSIDVMAYFFEPRILDVSEYNEDTFHGDTTEFDLIYRLEPTLTIGGLSYVETCLGDPIPLVQQFEPSLIELTANEEFNGNICPASDGYIIIRENVSSFGMGENEDTIYYTMGETIEYELIPGTPNLIADQDYKKHFTAILVRDDQTDTIDIDVVVLGHNPREQNYTTVTPQIPFHILHNPPGDASYSFLEESQAVSSSFTQSFLQEGSVDTYVRVQSGAAISVGLSIGIEASIEIATQFDVTASLGIGSGGLTEWASMITTTMSQSYQTSGNLNITGNSGDVYIGGAMNMLYGITDVLEYNFTLCEFEQSQTLFMQPQGIETTFMYTESHILDVIIPELQSITDYYNSVSEADSAAYFANQLVVWQQFVDRNHETIENSPEVETVSISGGVGYTNTLETSTSNSTSFDFNFYIEYGVAVDAGISVAGAGIFGGVAVNGRSTWGSVVETDTTYTTTVGYYLGDDDEGDDYAIQILNDEIYGVPAFKLISGQSSCPWEDGTVPREGVQLSVESTYQTVEETDVAVFVLQLANISQTDEEMTYDLVFDHATNPNGAVITIGGSPVVGDIPYPYTIAAWESVDVTITIAKGPTEYDYTGLKFIMQSSCDDQIYDEVFLNVHYYKEYDLNVVVDGSGTTNIGVGTSTYIEESIVNLYAIANMGYVFEKWIVGVNESYTPAVAVTMDIDKTATAYFVETSETQYSVNISKIGSGITTPPEGTYVYVEGAELDLVANPELYNAFVKWTVNGEEITDAITEIEINENTNIVAEFVGTHQLNMLVSGEGTTNPTPGYYTYNHGTEIGMFASPDVGYEFEKWTINGIEVLTQYVGLTIDEEITATAYFVSTAEEQHSLVISSATEGGYTIPPAGEYLYTDGSSVELTAVPTDGYVFEKWMIGGAENTNNPVQISISGDVDVEAYFKEINEGVNGENALNLCSIFPNPSNGMAVLTSNENIKEIRILDITGKLLEVFEGQNTQKQNLSLENYKPGIYLINVEVESGTLTLKMQILR